MAAELRKRIRLEPRHELVLLSAASISISYCDRVNLSVAIVPMAEELGYDMTERGMILSSFFYGYIVSQVIGAILARLYGGHLVLGTAGGLWSIATFVVPFLADNVYALLCGRVMLGLAEGVSFPVVYHLLSLNVPSEERSRSMACLSAGVFLGAVVSFVLSPIIVDWFGWQSVFYFFGSLGFIWLAAWIRWWQNVAEEVLSHVERHHDKDAVQLITSDLRQFVHATFQMLKSPLLCAIFWCHFCHNIGHYVLLTWLPTYFDEQLGLHGSSMSLTCLPYLSMTLTVLAVSKVADGYIQDGMEVNKVRRVSTACGFFGAAIFMLMLTTTRSQTTSIFYLCLALSSNGAGPVAGYEAAKLDITLPDQTGRVQAVSNTFATLAGIVGIPLVAFISQAFDSWNLVFAAVAVIFASAGGIFWRNGKWTSKLVLDA